MKMFLLILMICLSLSYASENYFLDDDFICPNNDTSACKPAKYKHLNQCDYVDNCCDDVIDDDVLINYLSIYYCNTWLNKYYIGIIFWCILLVYMFLFLDKIAEDYFAPILTSMSESLGLSPEFSGITFLAIGNGADDMSSAIFAIHNGGDDTKLAFGDLLGVAVLNLTFINATLAYVCYKHNVPGGTKLDKISLIRDLFFLLIIILLLLYIIICNKVTLFGSLLFLIIYAVYVLIVCVQEKFKHNKKRKNKQQSNIISALSINNEDDKLLRKPLTTNNININNINVATKIGGFETKENDNIDDNSSDSSSSSNSSSSSDSSIDWNKLKQTNIYKYWILRILLLPVFIVEMLCTLTIPSTNPKKWNDYIILFTCISSPVWFMFGFDLLDTDVAIGNVPIFAIVIGLAMIMMGIVLIKMIKIKKKYGKTNNVIYKVYFLFLGFLSSFAWIGLVADQLVTVLTTLGVISTIDLTILGITVLTWGNSIEDVIADSSVAKRGYFGMAIAGSISAPTVNIAISVGIGTFLKCIASSDNTFHIPSDTNLYLSAFAAIAQIIFTIIFVSMSYWRINKMFIVWSYIYYIVFIIATVVVYIVVGR